VFSTTHCRLNDQNYSHRCALQQLRLAVQGLWRALGDFIVELRCDRADMGLHRTALATALALSPLRFITPRAATSRILCE
jgi:hypothetical protein